MHFRLQLWMALFALVTVTGIRAQGPASTPSNGAAANPMPPGQIKAVQVVGSVHIILNGQTSDLHDNDPVLQSATVTTEEKSSVILVFSNGATTQLGSDSKLVIDEFLQDPFSQTVAVSTLTAEPTTSRTHLRLDKGELVGNVKHLNHDGGSTFTIDTPVGAAGIRGTTFRIVFRPSGTGQAFAIFSLSTVEGSVAFNNPSGPNTHGTNTPQGQGSQGPGQNRGGSVAVTTGQEVVVTISVDVNPTTGQVTVTAPVQIATTTPLNPVVRAEIISQATTMATTVEQSKTTFTSPGSTSGGTSSGSSSSSSSSTSTDSTKKDDSSTSGGDSSGTSSSSTSSSSTSSTASTGGTSSGSGSTGSSSTGTGSAGGQTNSNFSGTTQNNAPSFTSAPPTLTPIQ